MEKLNVKSKEALAWVAGFFSGEGCISLSFSKSTNGWCGQVEISQKNPKLLEIVRSVLTAHGIETPELRYGKGSRVFELLCNATKGAAFLQLVLPYPIGEKHRKRAEIYLRMYPPGQRHVKRRAERMNIYTEWLQLRIDELKKENNGTKRL